MPDLALVLAGGLGTRLRAVLADRPKSLAPAAGRPFLYYVLDYLQRQGVRRAVLCVGYLASQVQEYVREGQDWGLEITYSLEQSALGTGGALRQASAGLKDAFFALNGDTLFLADLPALWEQHVRLDGLATVALLRVGDGSTRGCVRLAVDGHIRAFDEKPDRIHVETQNFASQTQTQNLASLPDNRASRTQNNAPLLVNGGVYVLEPRALANIQPGQAASIEREVFPRLASRNQLAGLEQNAYFADIGTPGSLSAFERDVLDGKLNIKT
jgi:NDP-sugar pyrophosphorylase family protein